MCTATLISTDANPDHLRLVTNRDEQHTRLPAHPPQMRVCGERQALMPVDPSSDGTWVGVNDAGLVVTLVNLNLGHERVQRKADVSRGVVVPALLAHGGVSSAVGALEELPTGSMMPFRLLVADRNRVAVVRSCGSDVDIQLNPRGDDPVMLTSSGLGDELVEGPRRELFESISPRDAEAQDAFHRHAWPDRLELSVAMSRDEARTVSRTVVEVEDDRLSMTYTPVDRLGKEGTPQTYVLPQVAEVFD